MGLRVTSREAQGLVTGRGVGCVDPQDILPVPDFLILLRRGGGGGGGDRHGWVGGVKSGI